MKEAMFYDYGLAMKYIRENISEMATIDFDEYVCDDIAPSKKLQLAVYYEIGIGNAPLAYLWALHRLQRLPNTDGLDVSGEASELYGILSNKSDICTKCRIRWEPLSPEDKSMLKELQKTVGDKSIVTSLRLAGTESSGHSVLFETKKALKKYCSTLDCEHTVLSSTIRGIEIPADILNAVDGLTKAKSYFEQYQSLVGYFRSSSAFPPEFSLQVHKYMMASYFLGCLEGNPVHSAVVIKNPVDIALGQAKSLNLFR